MRRFSRGALAAFFVIAGTVHLLRPAPYLAIMPPFLPWPAALVALSGAAEIAGGLGVLLPWSRRAAAWGLIALLVAVFPANLQAIASGMSFDGWRVPVWLLWLRLPFQALFIAWVYVACLRAKANA